MRPSFAIPIEDDRVWVLFDWDAEGWQSFVSDPEVPPIMQEAGHTSRPQAAELGGQLRRLTQAPRSGDHPQAGPCSSRARSPMTSPGGVKSHE